MKKNGFSKIEILYMIVILSTIVIVGTSFAIMISRDKKVENFKKEIDSYLVSAKNFYAKLSIEKNEEYIKLADDETTRGMCVTLEGLKVNNYTSKDIKDWDGYIVIEEEGDKLYYSVWITDNKYLINGYSSTKLEELNLNNGVNKYHKESLSSKVKTSFTGTTNAKGGTGTGNSVKRYETKCINTKIE